MTGPMLADRADAPVSVSEPIEVHATKGGIIARSSVARGRSLAPGIQKTPFYWRDVVHGPPPRRRQRGDCVHVTFHGTDDSGDVRLAFTTIVRVDPGMDKDSPDDDITHVEERVYVQRRVLQELIDRERAFTDRIALRMRSRLAHSLVTQRRAANGIELAWMMTLALVLIRLQAKVGNALIRGFRGFMRAIVAIPDAILVQTERASIHLASRSGRRWLRKAIRDPASATPQEKAGVLVWLTFAMLAFAFVASMAFATVLSRWDVYFQRFLVDFTSSLLGAVAIPLPIEITFVNSVARVGYLLGGLGLFAGKMVGAWMLFLLGDSLFDGIQKKAKKSPRWAKAIRWLQSNANKYGFLLLVLLNGLPLAPDAMIIVFAVSGMRFRSFMWGIAVGTALKFVMLGALIFLVGPETVTQFMEHPIATLRGG